MYKINFLADTPGSMAVPGSPFYNPVRRDPELPADGPERYVCRVASNNPVPNAVSITIKPKCYTQNAVSITVKPKSPKCTSRSRGG